jgi:hypothetical protein
VEVIFLHPSTSALMADFDFFFVLIALYKISERFCYEFMKKACIENLLLISRDNPIDYENSEIEAAAGFVQSNNMPDFLKTG